MGVKVSVTDGYYTYKKGFVGKPVRVYIPRKEKIINPICKFCGFDNRKNPKPPKRNSEFSIIIERFNND